MEILARAVGRRKEAVAQVQMVRGTGQMIINTKPAHEYLQNDSCAILAVQAPFDIYKKVSSVQSDETNSFTVSDASQNAGLAQLNNSSIDTIIKVKGGGLKGQAEAIRLGIARALCAMVASSNAQTLATKEVTISTDSATTPNTGLRKQLKDKGYLTQDSRVKERRKYGLKKARKASQYHKR
jgi:small subunit ribosomal protein S9